MSETKNGEHSGHFLTKLDLNNALAQYFRTLFRVGDRTRELRDKALDSVGLATRDSLRGTVEELDRLHGLIAELERNNNGSE